MMKTRILSSTMTTADRAVLPLPAVRAAAEAAVTITAASAEAKSLLPAALVPMRQRPQMCIRQIRRRRPETASTRSFWCVWH